MKDLYDENGTVESQENEDTSYLAARRIRKMKKLNLQDMSNITGLSVAYLSKYENGKANSTIAALRKIAMALEVPVTCLLYTSGIKNSSNTMCNPIGQAKLLNEAKTDLNIVLGLCVGHDTLFFKYSDAPVTVLAVKDRVLAHNPLGAVYTAETFYRDKLFPSK